MSVLQKLTEGIVHRDVGREAHAMLTKWEKTGLLEGLGDERAKQSMAVLLENQAKELLREASSMAAGDVEGFAAVAFPIVRRVFGGLIANDLVSVQPMSLPSGLIFFLDFTHSSDRFGQKGQSLYGGGVVGRAITDGVTDIAETGFYGLTSGYSGATGSVELVTPTVAAVTTANATNSSTYDYDPDLGSNRLISFNIEAADVDSPALARMEPGQARAVGIAARNDCVGDADGDHDDSALFVDPDNGDLLLFVLADGGNGGVVFGTAIGNNEIGMARLKPVRRLSQVTTSTASNGLKEVTAIPRLLFELTEIRDCGAVAIPTTQTEANTRSGEGAAVTVTDAMATAVAADLAAAPVAQLQLEIPIRDSLIASTNALGSVVGADPWGLEEPTPAGGTAGTDTKASGGGQVQDIAEIDIKVDSVAVTAQTKKLKAKWTPELGQDLNAYHNLDAEVELTGILSEQIALEIDREILGELVDGAKAGTRYWSRAPGLFVNSAGAEQGAASAAPDFTGTVSEWYETLIETINDVSAQIHRKTLRGGANFVVVSPEVANILEFTSGFRASVTADQDRGTIGALKSGSLSKKFDVYVDPYFLRNVVLIGRKGSSFLESGYVYAPYVPLQVTPTIFGTEDFVPRKGVMTRYAKKMVRPDMYGLVIVRGLLGESGATA
jgi:hypothetical protein